MPEAQDPALQFVADTDVEPHDDLTGPNLPCFEAGSLLDLPYSELRSVTFLPGKTSFDVMWLMAEIVMVFGESLHVRVPAFYAGTGKSAIPQVRTGQMTTWERGHGYAEGAGQRDIKVVAEGGGFSMVGILQVQRIEFDPVAGGGGEKGEKPKSFWKRIFG